MNKVKNTASRKKDYHTSEKVMDTIAQEMEGSADNIKVNTYQGHVTLSGVVDVLSEKRMAEDAAFSVKGVKAIENSITVCTDGTITDNEAEKEVNKKLSNSLYHNRIHGVAAKVSGGTAILEGSVDTERDRKIAMNESAKALGVKDVVSHIKLSPDLDDATVANEVNRQYIMSYIDLQDVQRSVENGVVYLNGFVNNRKEMDNLVAIAEDVEGVRSVVNNLKERYWSLE